MNHVFTLVAICLVVGPLPAFPPPTKEQAKPDHDKLAKEAVEKLLAAVAEGKTDDAVKLMGFPFRDAQGEKQSVEEVTRTWKAESVTLSKLKIVVVGVFSLDSFSAWVKKERAKLEAVTNLDDLVEHAGKEARFVVIKIEEDAPNFGYNVVLVRPEKAGVKIVGVSR